MSKNMIISSVFAILSLIFLVLTVILPIIIKKATKNSASGKTDLSEENIELWGTFPGKLKSSIKHNFSFFDYSNISKEINYTLPLKKSLIFDEELKYGNYSKKEKEIYIKINRKFIQNKNESSNEGETVKLPSLGYYEYAQTILHLPIYTKIINGMKYLTEIIGSYDDVFLRKIFVLDNQNILLDEQKIKQEILKDISEKKRDFIYSHPTCGFKTLTLIFRWARIVGNPSLIQKEVWLKEELKLSDEEIEKILGENSPFGKMFADFQKTKEKQFDCNKETCKYVYRQLVDSSILKESSIDNIKSLNTKIHPNLTFFESPEMEYFYEVSEFKDKISYDELKLEYNQLFSLFDINSNTSLYNQNISNLLQNSIENKILSQELKDKFNFKSFEQGKFLFDYISDHIPKLYYFYTFQSEGVEYEVSQTAKMTVNSIQSYITKFLGKFWNKKDDLYDELLFPFFKSYQNLTEDLEEICPIILQPILDDGKKVLKICSDPKISLTSKESLKNWINVYFCYASDKGICDEKMKEYFMSNDWIISEKEMKRIFDGEKEGIKDTIDLTFGKMKERYGCVSSPCRSDELLKIQYLYSSISLNPPKGINITSYSLKDIFPNLFTDEFELSYFQHSFNISDIDLPRKLKEGLINLRNQENNIFLDDFSEGLVIRHNLEIIYSLFEKNITSSEYSKIYDLEDVSVFVSFMDKLIKDNITNSNEDDNLIEYKLMNILQGNNEEDAKYVKLISNGNYYEGYKPGFKKTTGFDLPLTDFENLGSYSFNSEKNDQFRKILSMNEKQYFNIKKEEYSPSENRTIPIYVNLYNGSNLVKENEWVSDGYEYSVENSPKSIFYYDFISGRKLRFDFEKQDTINNIDCDNYSLNNDLVQNLIEPGIDSKYATVSQKFNKPFFIATEEQIFEYNITKTNKKSYICVEPFSSMVIDSDINLIYAINTTGLTKSDSSQNLKEGALPLISYNRHYSIENDNYSNVFSGIKGYKTAKIIIIALGIVIIVIFVNLCVYFYLKMGKKEDQKDPLSINPDKSQDEFIPNEEVNISNGTV